LGAAVETQDAPEARRAALRCERRPSQAREATSCENRAGVRIRRFRDSIFRACAASSLWARAGTHQRLVSCDRPFLAGVRPAVQDVAAADVEPPSRTASVANMAPSAGGWAGRQCAGHAPGVRAGGDPGCHSSEAASVVQAGGSAHQPTGATVARWVGAGGGGGGGEGGEARSAHPPPVVGSAWSACAPSLRGSRLGRLASARCVGRRGQRVRRRGGARGGARGMGGWHRRVVWVGEVSVCAVVARLAAWAACISALCGSAGSACAPSLRGSRHGRLASARCVGRLGQRVRRRVGARGLGGWHQRVVWVAVVSMCAVVAWRELRPGPLPVCCVCAGRVSSRVVWESHLAASTLRPPPFSARWC
jgi:hypothetical protein